MDKGLQQALVLSLGWGRIHTCECKTIKRTVIV